MVNKLTITETTDDCEDVDCVVCMRLTSPLMLPDNLIDLCSRCGEAIQHRPHVPKRPPKVCAECIGPAMIANMEKGELEVKVTPRSINEAADRKKNMH